MGKKREFRKTVRQEVRANKSEFIVFTVLNVLVLFALVRQFFLGNFESVFLCILTLFLLVIPAIVEVKFKMELPPTLSIVIMLFIFSAEILGEINNFYVLIPFWDTILHTLNGFLAAAIGCSLIVILNHNERLMFKLSPVFVAIVAFCFSMTIGVLWEFFEFGMDVLFNLDMQKDTVITSFGSVLLDETNSNIAIQYNNITSTAVNGNDLGIDGYLDVGLYDTMEDLWVNFIGAVVFSVLGYFYTKNQGKGKIAKGFMPTISKKYK